MGNPFNYFYIGAPYTRVQIRINADQCGLPKSRLMWTYVKTVYIV